MMKTSILTLLLSGFLVTACNPTPDIDDLTMLDGDQIFDLSLTQPEKYMVSVYLPNPTDVQKNIPVLIAAHGYSASTFEWDEMREYADSKGTFLVSQVLLGGHGRSYADFKKASWKDWQSSIVDEFNKLHSKGFRNIYLVGSSTGAPLILQLISEGFFSNQKAPKGIFLVDPNVVSSNKTLTLVSVIGPVLGYTTTDLDDGEKGKWYVYRPQESLKQLLQLTNITRKNLENGMKLPEGCMAKIYKSIIDRTADPVSASLIHRGLRKFDGKTIQVEMLDSELHVMTRLRGRENISSKDVLLQRQIFADMESIMQGEN